MNGIMPGPLWLAIASATNGASPENRTLIQHSRSDNVARKMVESQKGVADSERKRIGGGGAELHASKRSREREGG
jgi:hypothetical protein